MPKVTHKKHKAMKENKPEIGSVLFSAGDTLHEDEWDDTELIDHWDKNVEQYRRLYSKQSGSSTDPPFQQSKKEQSVGTNNAKKHKKAVREPERVNTQPKKPSPLHQHANRVSPDEDNLSNLIMSWYYCGYYTGIYQVQPT
ncbi:hypothetical protein BDB01DRAFT_791541 [Pilobolus umbonatus]|nr:hypothetical protein BDB01DRAFT_791541 [Pilobolus umbonatus]